MKTLRLIIILVLIAGCQFEKKQEQTMENETISTLETIKPLTAETLETAIIYEANIRQYSPEGSFEAFTKDIPELKKLGVKVIWVMPIFPISEVKRKAFGDKFVSDIEDEEERKKYLGSYYAVSDFRKINPEFGNIEDFRNLVKTAHENDIYVILDWVPNHTGWDHRWISENPEYYTKNGKGEITDPLNPDGTPVGWADVADLNYDNMDMRRQMTDDMLYWITEENIDGFRCDMAGMVPIDFWEKAIPELRSKKQIFMLAEAWEPQLMKDDLFDMAYGWDRHHTMNHIAKGEATAKAWDEVFQKDRERYAEDDILMTFVTNHDENSWAGSVPERMGDAAPLFTALSYTVPGMPLIYSGQEYGMDHRLKFFEKDSIPKEKGSEWELLVKLGKLKSGNQALHGGKNAAKYTRLDAQNENVIYFEREKNGEQLVFIGNMSNTKQRGKLQLSGSYLDVIKEDSMTFTGMEVVESTLEPWEFQILVKKINE